VENTYRVCITKGHVDFAACVLGLASDQIVVESLESILRRLFTNRYTLAFTILSAC
jgi:hypothetical protein